MPDAGAPDFESVDRPRRLPEEDEAASWTAEWKAIDDEPLGEATGQWTPDWADGPGRDRPHAADPTRVTGLDPVGAGDAGVPSDPRMTAEDLADRSFGAPAFGSDPGPGDTAYGAASADRPGLSTPDRPAGATQGWPAPPADLPQGDLTSDWASTPPSEGHAPATAGWPEPVGGETTGVWAASRRTGEFGDDPAAYDDRPDAAAGGTAVWTADPAATGSSGESWPQADGEEPGGIRPRLTPPQDRLVYSAATGAPEEPVRGRRGGEDDGDGFPGSRWDDEEPPKKRLRVALLAAAAAVVVLGGTAAGVKLLGSASPDQVTASSCVEDAGCAEATPEPSAADTAIAEEPEPEEVPEEEPVEEPEPETTEDVGEPVRQVATQPPQRTAERSPTPRETERRTPKPTKSATPEPEPSSRTTAPPSPDVQESPTEEQQEVQVPAPRATGDPTDDDTLLTEPTNSPEEPISERDEPSDGAIRVDFDVVDTRTRLLVASYTAELSVRNDTAEDMEGMRLSIPVSGVVKDVDGGGVTWRQDSGRLVLDYDDRLPAGAEVTITFTARGKAKTPSSCDVSGASCKLT
ncbi:hypothetical protein [Thermostaphylospora chromogena]|uniref:Uncharacterized protein n=1 Tax=Thermostaphylospora chromogena TaxID=35622 RepID=A0A1H1ACX2_9ACTN|nr:hypothetical protein [Thermostaphylospora chromogena]SDQ37543.1 hypothetical protein SAMN04489764_0436 [Thermostaphylospora chromogena]